ncbi:hypothetical protein Syun_017016 [Stephania yunnanensis]|uniref:Uncharacterized protein n=1 Tax=Stephania yunnanensis TaxID=152371 RepID=A0AAP0J659_9MAGN
MLVYAVKQDHGTVKSESSTTELFGMQRIGDAHLLKSECVDLELFGVIKGDLIADLVADLKEQVLEEEANELQQALTNKQGQEHTMLRSFSHMHYQVLMRVEKEQRITKDASISAEQNVAAQKPDAIMLQEKYDDTMASIVQMEERLIITQSTSEATLHYQTGSVKEHQSPRFRRSTMVAKQGKSSAAKCPVLSTKMGFPQSAGLAQPQSEADMFVYLLRMLRTALVKEAGDGVMAYHVFGPALALNMSHLSGGRARRRLAIIPEPATRHCINYEGDNNDDLSET